MGNRITLMDKWNEVEQKIQKIEDDVISTYFKDREKPQVVYVVYGYKGIEEYQVKGFHINEFEATKRWKPSFNKKPTKKDLEKLMEFLQIFSPTEEHISLHYECKRDTGTMSGAVLLHEINSNDSNWSFTKEGLIPKLQEMKRLYEPKEGYVACAYCGEQRLLEDIITGTIISYHNWKSGESPPRNYCKDEPCHGYDQMGHEG